MAMRKCRCRCDDHKIVLPPEVIEALYLAPDAEIEFRLSENGDVIVCNPCGVVRITPEMIDSVDSFRL